MDLFPTWILGHYLHLRISLGVNWRPDFLYSEYNYITPKTIREKRHSVKHINHYIPYDVPGPPIPSIDDHNWMKFVFYLSNMYSRAYTWGGTVDNTILKALRICGGECNRPKRLMKCILNTALRMAVNSFPLYQQTLSCSDYIQHYNN